MTLILSYYSFSEFSFSFWTVQQFYIDLPFSFPFKIFMQHISSCSARFMSITAFDLIDKFFQDTFLQLQFVSFNQLIAGLSSLSFSSSVIHGQLTTYFTIVTHCTFKHKALRLNSISRFLHISIFSAILRCCVLWIIPAKFNFSILHCGRFRITFWIFSVHF